jgi:hypothetical protein
MLTLSYLASGDERNIALESADAEEEEDAGARGTLASMLEDGFAVSQAARG